MPMEQKRTVSPVIECTDVCKSFVTPEGEH